MLRRGEQAICHSNDGNLTIEAIDDVTRVFKGADWSKTVKMLVRDEPRDRHRGLYCAGDAWFTAPKIYFTADEGIAKFDTQAQARQWVQNQSSNYGARAYTPSGLAFRLWRRPGPGGSSTAIHVELIKVLVAGKQAQLPDGNPNAVRIENIATR